MGRTIMCPHCKATMNEDIWKKRNSVNTCLVCGESLDDGNLDDQSDWITWYYYGFKDDSSSGYLMDKPVNLDKPGETSYLIKEFKAPPRDENGKSDAAKKELRKYVPDAFAPSTTPSVFCPRCGSTEYTLLNRGYSIFTGFLGSGKVKRVCNNCKREF